MSITKIDLQNPQTYGSKITHTSTTHGSKKKSKGKSVLCMELKLNTTYQNLRDAANAELEGNSQHYMLLLEMKKALQSMTQTSTFKKQGGGASLVAQWLRIHLSMQGTRVQALVRKIPCAAEQLSPRATTTEPASHNY